MVKHPKPRAADLRRSPAASPSVQRKTNPVTVSSSADLSAGPGWDQLCAQLASISRTFHLATGQEAVAAAREEAAGDRWGLVVAASDVADVSTGAAQELLGRYAAARDLPMTKHVASLVFQRYAHRVAGVGVATWMLTGFIPDVRARECHLLVRDGSPSQLLLATPRVRRDADPECWADTVIEGHLLPVADALHQVGGIGMSILWGNMGAAIAAACRHVSQHLPIERVQEQGQTLLDTRPLLGFSGTFRVVADDQRQLLFFDRNTCCQWYATRAGKFCSWCSRISHEERTQRFRRILARSGTVGPGHP